MYSYIEPEVAGGLGEQTILHNNVFPPLVEKLHYEFDDWLGDDILESFPCFIVTDRLKTCIEKTGLTGMTFDKVVISKSEKFMDLHAEWVLPTFHWAKISGTLMADDFAIANNFRLMVSEKAFRLLNTFKLTNAIVNEVR